MTVKFVGPSGEAVIEEDGNYNYNCQTRGRRLIDAEALIAALLEARREETETTPKLVRFIRKQPTVVGAEMSLPEPKCAEGCLYGFGSDECEGCLFTTVKPRRGRWIKKEERVWYWYECSECGESPLFRNGERVLSDYCPNCGARMERERK